MIGSTTECRIKIRVTIVMLTLLLKIINHSLNLVNAIQQDNPFLPPPSVKNYYYYTINIVKIEENVKRN